MSKEIEKFDKNGNEIYFKDSYGYECWKKYDENNNKIYVKDSSGNKWWREYDNRGNCIHYKNINGDEEWYKYDENNKEIEITEQEFENIEFNIKIKEYNSRTKCSRFELIDI